MPDIIKKINEKAILLSVMVLLLFAAVSCGRKADSELILQRADYFAKAVSNLNSDKLLRSVDDVDDNTGRKLRDKMNISDLDEDHNLMMRVIAGSIQYEIDKESLQIGDDNESAEVDIRFTIVDYKAVIADKNLRNAEKIARELGDANLKLGYVVRCGLVYTDDQWMITSDTLKELSELYSFLDDDIRLGYSSEEIGNMIESVSWMQEPVDGSFTNVSYLKVEFKMNGEVPYGDKFYYIVKYNGSEVYKSDNIGLYRKLSCMLDETNGAVMDDGYLAAGLYTFSLYGAKDDGLITEESINVMRSIPLPTSSPVDPAGGTGVVPAGTDGYMINVSGVNFRVNTDMNEYMPMIKELGLKYDLIAPKDSSLKDYYFMNSAVYIHTVPSGDKDVIRFMSLNNGEVWTPEGIGLGDSRDLVLSVYGVPAQDMGTIYYYTLNDTRLIIGFNDDSKVEYIRYDT